MSMRGDSTPMSGHTIRENGCEPHPNGGREASLSTAVQQEDDAHKTRLLHLAANLLARSRRLESRIATIESVSQACKCADVVAGSISEILDHAKTLLVKMREYPDPNARNVLSNSFNNILLQIDRMVSDGYYDTKNLAKSDNIFVVTDERNRGGFSIAGIDMSCHGLGLEPFEGEVISDADIVERLSKVETAASNLAAHAVSYETVAGLLQTHMKFARGMIDILDEGNNQITTSRLGHQAVEQALSDICGTIGSENKLADRPSREKWMV